jgi:hypothetical protein
MKDGLTEDQYASLVADLPGYSPNAVRLKLTRAGIPAQPLEHRFRFTDSLVRTLEVRSLGKPLAGATVDLVRVDGQEELASNLLATYTTGADVYEVFVYARGHAPARAIWSPAAPLTVALAPASVMLEVEGAVRGQLVSVRPVGSSNTVAVARVASAPVAFPLAPGDYGVTALDDTGRLVTASHAMASDEDLSLDIRDVQIALGNLRAAAQAHADAQQLAGDRKLEVPPAIAPLLSQATPAVDPAGWRRIAIRPRSGNAPHSSGTGRQVVLACTVSAAGATEECTVLEGGAAPQAAAVGDAALVTFPSVNWRGTPEKITRLIRLVYRPDGGIEAFEAASMAAMAQVRRLMPSTKPAEAGTVN